MTENPSVKVVGVVKTKKVKVTYRDIPDSGAEHEEILDVAIPENLYWKAHTSGLFNEIIKGGDNDCNHVFKQPLKIMYGILQEVALRAIELDDPQLNVLMLRLSLYSISNPDNPEYDAQKVEQYISQVRNSK